MLSLRKNFVNIAVAEFVRHFLAYVLIDEHSLEFAQSVAAAQGLTNHVASLSEIRCFARRLK